MIQTTGRLADAFWRAAAYCLHPRVILLSILPLLLAGVSAAGLSYFFWESAVDGVRSTLGSWHLLEALLGWFDYMGWQSLRAMLAPALVLVLAIPCILLASLLLVALMMTPAMSRLVARRRFAGLECRHGGSAWMSVLWSLGHTLLALLVLVLSMPLWLIPPLALFVPPLIWAWLAYRVFVFDVLSEHASSDERRQILREHRGGLLALGLVTGYLGAAPASLLLLFMPMAPLLAFPAVWLYTLVFAFSSLWFAHYALAALADLRQRERERERAGQDTAAVAAADTVLAPDQPALPPIPLV